MAICVLSDGRGGVEGHAREQNEGWSEEGNREDQRKDQHDSQNEGQSEGKEGHDDRGGRGDGSSPDTGSASPTATKTIAVGPGVLVLRLPTCVPQHVTRPTSPSTPRRAGGLRGGAEGGREGGGEEGWSAHSNRPMPCVVRVGVSGGSLLRYRETVFGAVETAGTVGAAGSSGSSGSSPPPSSFRTPSSPTASVASSCESANDDSLHDCLSDADRCAHELTASMSTPSLPRSSVLYHGRLQRHLPAWSAMASPYIAGWIKDGVHVQFVRTPTRHRKVSRISNVRERLFAREQVAELLRRGVIGVDPKAEVICPLGVAPKKGPDLFRLIHNVRFVNEFCEPRPFTYEKLTDLQNVLKSGWWMGKLDLSAGYHHVPLHPSQHKFFGFEFEGKVYTWRQLFFGLSPAPYIFTMILRDVAKRWRFDGIFLIHYLDAFGVFAPTRELCLQQLTRCCKLVH